MFKKETRPTKQWTSFALKLGKDINLTIHLLTNTGNITKK